MLDDEVVELAALAVADELPDADDAPLAEAFGWDVVTLVEVADVEDGTDALGGGLLALPVVAVAREVAVDDVVTGAVAVVAAGDWVRTVVGGVTP